MSDVIESLKADHRKVEGIFEQLESGSGDRGALIEQLIQEVKVHALAEEQVVYPAIRDAVGDSPVDEAEQEHQQVQELLDRLEPLAPDDAEVDTILQELKQNIQHHVEEEEGEVFPKFAREASADTLDELAGRIEQVKSSVGAFAEDLSEADLEADKDQRGVREG